MEDKVAWGIAIFVLFVVPVTLIALFWMVHVLPEKIAHRRHHPQFEAIRTLCLLSLVFGGLLWPIAFIWAKSKPVLHKMAYGTDKHADFEPATAAEAGAAAAAVVGKPLGEIRQEDLAQLRAQLDALELRAPLPPELVAIRSKLRDLEWRWAVSGTVAPASDGTERSHA